MSFVVIGRCRRVRNWPRTPLSNAALAERVHLLAGHVFRRLRRHHELVVVICAYHVVHQLYCSHRSLNVVSLPLRGSGADFIFAPIVVAIRMGSRFTPALILPVFHIS